MIIYSLRPVSIHGIQSQQKTNPKCEMTQRVQLLWITCHISANSKHNSMPTHGSAILAL